MRLVTTLCLLLAACGPRVDLGNDDAPDADSPDAAVSVDAGASGQDASLCPGFEGEILEVQPRDWSRNPQTGLMTWECSLDLKGYATSGLSDGISFTNHGTTPLTLSGLTIEQDSTKGDAFSFDPSSPVGEIRLQPCESVRVWIRLAAGLSGTYFGRLSYLSDDPARPNGYCLLTSKGFKPKITVEPQRLDFEAVEVGQRQNRRVTISNTGVDVAGTTDDNLKLMRPDAALPCSYGTDCVSNVCVRGACWNEAFPVVESAGDFTVSVPPEGYSPAGISAGQSVDLKVLFAPLSPGPKSGRLTIYSNDLDSPAVVVELTGTGK